MKRAMMIMMRASFMAVQRRHRDRTAALGAVALLWTTTTVSAFSTATSSWRMITSRNKRSRPWQQSASCQYATFKSNDNLPSPLSLFDEGGTTVHQALDTAVTYLEQHEISEVEMSVTNLLAQTLELNWKTGYRELQRILDGSYSKSPLAMQELTVAQTRQFQEQLQRRASHEPLQYIMGKWDFLDYTLQIESPLLCPRPETEELVSMLVQTYHLPADKKTMLNILDIGCGTGAIGIALADQLPHSQVTAIDIDPIAVEVSNRNAQHILKDDSERYRAVLASIDDYHAEPSSNQKKFDLIVSNPPYIPETDAVTLHPTVLEYESPQALFAGQDGLDVIRVILRRLPALASESGADCWMEVDPSHPTKLQSILKQQEHSKTLEFVQTYQDMFGLDRFVQIRVKKKTDDDMKE
jgi:release factor glutamine methyltransferase